MTKRVVSSLKWAKKVLLVACGLMATVVPVLLGQVNRTPGGQPTVQVKKEEINLPVFDVVSVKLNKSGTMMFRAGFTPDGLKILNAPVLMLLRQAYGLNNSNNDQIQGVPGWAKSERYDIEAKVDGADVAEFSKLSQKQQQSMLQALLADRFKLTVHRETRQLPIYALTIAKNGPKIHAAKPGDTYPNGLKVAQGESGAGMFTMQDGDIEAQGISMSDLVSMLTQETGRTVLDKTGLTGLYDIALKWAPDQDSTQASTPGPDLPGASIFTAIQEQLGLRLDSQKGPVEGLVVDHIEKPSAN